MSPRHSGNGSFLQGATNIVLAHLENEHFGVSELARELGMSRSNLHRKIHTITGKSASQFIREVRLNEALELLKDSELTVSEVAFRVGFGSATYFSKCFHDQFGFPPGEAKKNGCGESDALHSHLKEAAGNHTRTRILSSWVITSVVFILAVIILIIAFKPFTGKYPEQQYVIAVLPFHNDSPDQENDYIINSMMDEIMTKLSALDGVKLVSRTTSEAYRNSGKSMRQIGEEMQADYILEGSATLLNNQTRMRLQLIETLTDSHVWAEPFERLVNEENLFRVQEDVALAVARDLNLLLNPQQEKEIERRPTENMEAYHAYLEARNLINVTTYFLETEPDDPRLKRVKQLLNHAISLDSSFSQPYTMMAHLYIDILSNMDREGQPEKAYANLDTGFHYINKALSFYEGGENNRTPDLNYIQALNMKGSYYVLKGQYEEAQPIWEELNEYKHLTKTYVDYQNIADGNYMWNNYLGCVKNYLKFIQLKPGDYLEPAWSIYSICNSYRGAGFPVLARQERTRLLEMDMDSISYFAYLAYAERSNGNYREALRYLNWVCRRDSTNAWYWTQVSRNHFLLGEPEKAVSVILKRNNRLVREPTDYKPDFVIGYVYLLSGMKEKGDSIINHYIKVTSERIQYPLPETIRGTNPYNLARAYSILGNREKTLEYLEFMKDLPGIDIYFITELKDWPTFDFVRDTPEFQEILSILEKRFNDTHEQIARLLEDHGIDPA